MRERTLISSGVAAFNCALSDDAEGGYLAGGMVNIIGDSHAGKTIMALTCLAEAAMDGDMDEYRLIYDDAEHRNQFDLEEMFGPLVDRMEPPAKDEDGNPYYSYVVEDFQDNIWNALHDEDGRPCIYVLDSLDALDAQEDIDAFEAAMEARQKGKEVSGSYGTRKARIMSETLRRVCGWLEATESLLIIVSQTRDKIGLGFAEKTRSGGKALKFYANHEIWLACVKQLKKKDLAFGSVTKAKVKKNSVTGKLRDMEFCIYSDYGVDDLQCSIDFLVACKWWGKAKQTIHAEEFDIKATKAKLIEHIEEEELEEDLRAIVHEAWNEREEDLKQNRKKRFQ